MSKLIDAKERDFITGQTDEGLETAIFVKAGAGAGKTHSIKNRVLNLILKKNLKPEELIIITYTKKAAAELQVRIRSVIEENIAKHPELSKTLAELPKAKISTVHSFCYDLLLEYPIEFNLDPESKVIDDTSKEVLFENLNNEFMSHFHEKGDYYKSHEKSFQAFESLLETFDATKIFEYFETLYDNRDLIPMPLNLSEGDSIKDEVQEKFKTFLESVKEILPSIKSGKEEDKLYVLTLDAFEKIPKLKEKLTKKCVAELFEDIDEILSTFKGNVGSKGNYTDTSIVENYKAALKGLKEVKASFSPWEKLAHYNKLVLSFDAFKNLISFEKKKRNLIDFFDCLVMVRDALKINTVLRKTIQNRFKALIIDEYQDSDPIQREIAFYLSENAPSKLVLVGDGKQSIYGFARADIEVYNETENLVVKDLKGTVANLTTNFRSENTVIEFINKHFKTILTPPKGNEFLGVTYDPMDTAPDKNPSKGKVEHWSLETTLPTDEKNLKGETRIREGFLVGNEIKKLLTQNYSPKDFMILFRNSTAMASYERGLEMAGVPVVNIRSKDFLCRGESREILNLLKYLSKPVPFNEEALKKCRFIMGEIPETLKDIAQSNLSLQWKLESAIKEIGFNEFALEQKDSYWIEALENAKKLLLSELEGNNFDLEYALARLSKKSESSFSKIKINDEKLFFESVDAVRLMTIHSAKGLEAKFVILAGHDSDTDVDKVEFFVDRKKGEIFISPPGLSKGDWENLTGTSLSSLLSHIQLKSSEEEKRVLYVALTRTIENLVIVSNSNTTPASFYDPIAAILDQDQNLKKSLSIIPEEEHYKSLQFKKTDKYHPIETVSLKDEDTKLLNTIVAYSVPVTTLMSDKSIFLGHQGRTDGMRFGTFVHKTMEVIVHKLRANISFDPDTLIDHLTKNEEPFKDEYIADFKLALKRFMKSDLPEKIKIAKDAQTEIPFAEGSYHGVIDLLLDFDDHAEVIDWKSDLIGSDDEFLKLKSHYAKQMEHYVLFLKKDIFKDKKVEGECIFLFNN